MATIDELAERLQQFFAAKFPPGQGDGPGTVLLIFDSLGTPLTAGEYIGSGSDAAIDILAHQAAARLADQLPAANLLAAGWFLPRAGSRLSNWYQQIVSSAVAVATDEASIQNFEALKSAASNDLRQNKLGLASGTVLGGSGGTVDAPGTHDQYYATSMTPVDWFMPDASCWQLYDLHSADNVPPLPPIAVDRPRFSFRVARDLESPDLSKFVARAVQDREVIHPPQPIDAVVDLEGEAVLRVGPVLRISPDAVAGPEGEAMLRAGPALRISSGQNFGAVEAISAAALQQSVLSLTVQDLPRQTSLDLSRPVLGLNNDVPLLIIDPVQVHDATIPATPTSDNFEVTFDYCMVRFDRPWWAEILLFSRQWTVPGYAPGDIASGSASAPTGPVTLITIGTLVVKNLKIRAKWSDADKVALSGSTSLGPFCIAGADYNSGSGEISRPGMQAIAWLCQVPPRVPPTPI